VFETRFVDGAFRRTVLIDSKQSQANRAEEGLLAARRDGGGAARIPVIEVAYAGRAALSDLELPHRAVDAHVRFATQDGEPVVKREWYQALRAATHADLSPVFGTAPAMLAFGGWDSTRRSGQLRLRGLLVSELFGVVDDREDRLSRRSGARLDPLGQDFYVTPEELARLTELQRDYISPKLAEKLDKEVVAAVRKKQEAISASELNLGVFRRGRSRRLACRCLRCGERGRSRLRVCVACGSAGRLMRTSRRGRLCWRCCCSAWPTVMPILICAPTAMFQLRTRVSCWTTLR
jgi:CRISPR-associated protein Csb1